MNDYSVPGYSRKRLISKFRDRIHPGEENNWDSWGCELISLVFSTHSDAFGQIRSVLSALAGDSRSLHGCRSTYLGGLHVHIGLPRDHWPEELRLATLQHLAYILFLFEPTISSLHSHHRRPYNDSSNPHYEDLEPNRRVLDPGYFVDYDDPDEYYYSLRRDWGDKSTQQPPTIVSTSRLRQKIWDLGQTISGLSNFIRCDKGFLVSWRKLVNILDDPERVETLEFRQHPGTADPDEIKHWVLFILALVRASYMKATTPSPVPQGEVWEQQWEQQGAKYSRDTWGDADNEEDLEDLLSLLELNNEEKRYWKGRFALYSERDISEEISHRKRNKEWEREELIRQAKRDAGEPVSGEVIVSDDNTDSSDYESETHEDESEYEGEEGGEEEGDDDEEQREEEIGEGDDNDAIASNNGHDNEEVGELPKKRHKRYRRRTTWAIPLSRLGPS